MNTIIKRALIFLTCVATTAPLVAQKTDDAYSLFEKKEYVKDEYKLPYRILYPDNMKKGEKYPLFIFLHGIGLGGKDNERHLQRGAELFLKPENRAKYPSIVVYPQAPFAKSFVEIERKGKSSFLKDSRKMSDEEVNRDKLSMSLSPYGEMVYEVIVQLIEGGAVDTDRIYISGASMGAFTTFQLITEHPDLFAAAAPMSGGASLSTIKRWAGKVPVWIIHGEKDPMVPVESSRIVVEELKRLGVSSFKYSEYLKVGHHSWDVAFEDPGYLEWFFSKSKKQQ